MTSGRPSRDAAHFQRLYDADPDPWRFGSSRYEQAKYRRTIQSLGGEQFRSGLEVGCSIGVLTRLLAPHCAALLAIDLLEAPLADARRRCADLPWVRFARMQVPCMWPDGTFDLIVLSEVLYFLSPQDVAAVADRAAATLRHHGVVLMVNWRGQSDDPCTGDEAANIFIERTEAWLQPQTQYLTDAYRLDVLRRT